MVNLRQIDALLVAATKADTLADRQRAALQIRELFWNAPYDPAQTMPLVEHTPESSPFPRRTEDAFASPAVNAYPKKMKRLNSADITVANASEERLKAADGYYPAVPEAPTHPLVAPLAKFPASAV